MRRLTNLTLSSRWGTGHQRPVKEGTGGVSCYVSHSWPESLEPHAFDVEGSQTILPIHIWQVEQMAAGAEAQAHP